MYLQEAGVGPDRQVKLGCVCDEQDVAVYVDGGSHRSEEQGENVPRLVCGDQDGGAEVLRLKQKGKSADVTIHISAVWML